MHPSDNNQLPSHTQQASAHAQQTPVHTQQQSSHVPLESDHAPQTSVNAPLAITTDQEKLLQSALRIKILSILAEEVLTSKQVSQKLNRSPGNVHYHIQKLHEGGLLELVRTEPSGGVIQKFYKARSAWFKSQEFQGFHFRKEDKAEHLLTRLSLSEAEFARFREDLAAFISKWESADTSGTEYGMEIIIGRLPAPEDDRPGPEGGASHVAGK